MQATRIIGVSRRTIYLWIRTGKLTVAGKTPGGATRLYEDELLRKDKK